MAILLALVMVLSIAACGKDNEPDNDAGTGKETQSQQGGQIQPGGNEALPELPLPEGWDENKYGAYIYEVWDSEFLPDCFPEAPEGVKVDQTTLRTLSTTT